MKPLAAALRITMTAKRMSAVDDDAPALAGAIVYHAGEVCEPVLYDPFSDHKYTYPEFIIIKHLCP